MPQYPETPKKMKKKNTFLFFLTSVSPFIYMYVCIYRHLTHFQNTFKPNKQHYPKVSLNLILSAVMSGLVDIWTSEVSKRREKEDHTHHNTIGSSSAAAGSTSTHTQHEPQKSNSTGLGAAVAQLVQFNKPTLLISEASLSMLLDCCSPWRKEEREEKEGI